MTTLNTTEADDARTINSLTAIIESRPGPTMSNDLLTFAIQHVRALRADINRLKKSVTHAADL